VYYDNDDDDFSLFKVRLLDNYKDRYIYIYIAEISGEGPGSKIIFFIFSFLHLTDFSQISKNNSFLGQFSSPVYPKCKPSTSIYSTEGFRLLNDPS